MTVAVQPNVAALRTHPYAGFWVRTLAFLVDGIAIGIVVGVVTVGRPLATDAGGTVIFSTWRNFLETIIGFGYFTLFWSRIGGGQTLGMRLLGLRVVGTDGHPIGYGTAVLRWIGLVISAAVILIGLVWVAFDARKQGWHDKMASTHVMHADALGATPPAQGSLVGSESPPHPVARGFAAVLGLGGALLGLVAFGLGMAGDPVVSSLTTLSAALGLTLIGMVGAGLAWWRPALAAGLLAVALVGFAFTLGPLAGPWYDGLLAATASGPVAESAYWIDAPAMGVFLASAVFMIIAAALSLLATIRDGA